MIQFCEIINTGTNIRIVTRDSENENFNDPIEFEIDIEVSSLTELISIIKNNLENGSVYVDRNNR